MPAINFFHIFFVVPIFTYICVENYNGRALPIEFVIFLIVLTVFKFLYHFCRAIKPYCRPPLKN